LHVAQLMPLPLPLTVSCFSKIQIGSTFLVPAHLGSPRKRAVKRVCVFVSAAKVWHLGIKFGFNTNPDISTIFQGIVEHDEVRMLGVSCD